MLFVFGAGLIFLGSVVDSIVIGEALMSGYKPQTLPVIKIIYLIGGVIFLPGFIMLLKEVHSGDCDFSWLKKNKD